VSASLSRLGLAPLASLGFAAGIAQAVLLREAMAAAGGSELSWGVVLGLWLAGMAFGARLGVRRGSAAVAGWCPVVVAALAAGGVVLLRAAPALVGATPGEGVGAWRAVGVWVAAVVPAATAGGWGFSVLAGCLGGADAAGAAYAVEGLGAMAGGLLFTLALAPLGSLAVLALAAGGVAGVLLAGRGMPGAALVATIAGVAAALVPGGWLARAAWAWSGRPGELGAWRETHEQRLEVSTGPPFSLYADGRLVSTIPDPYRVDPVGHLAMLLHPAPRRVLAVGALSEGVLPAMLQHPVERMDVVEEDRELPLVLAAWLGDEVRRPMADPRVRVRKADPVTVLRDGQRWDLILLRDGDPLTLRRNRTRTREFFAACRRCLSPGGVLVVRVGVGDTYLGGAGGELLATLAHTLRQVFPEVVALPGEEVTLVAGRDVAVDRDVLAERLAARGIPEETFPPAMLPLLLDPDRAAGLNRFVRAAAAAPNTTDHPRAVPLAAGRAEGRGSPRLAQGVAKVVRQPPTALWWAVAALAVTLLGRGVGAANLGREAAAVVGAASMGWFVVLLSAWQGREGSTYSAIGALSAAFMGGLVAGSWFVRRRAAGMAGRLWWLAAAAAVFSLLVGGLAKVQPPSAGIVAGLVAAGAVTGVTFPAVAFRIGGGRAREGAGRGFAADELGAACSALVVGVVVIPWVGMTGTAAALAGVTGALAAALLLADWRRGR